MFVVFLWYKVVQCDCFSQLMKTCFFNLDPNIKILTCICFNKTELIQETFKSRSSEEVLQMWFKYECLCSLLCFYRMMKSSNTVSRWRKSRTGLFLLLDHSHQILHVWFILSEYFLLTLFLHFLSAAGVDEKIQDPGGAVWAADGGWPGGGRWCSSETVHSCNKMLSSAS